MAAGITVSLDSPCRTLVPPSIKASDALSAGVCSEVLPFRSAVKAMQLKAYH